MTLDEQYMSYAIHLARQGSRAVRLNPHVGAVLVYNHTIIGYGFHEYFGGPHAEVNCINSLSPKDKLLLPHATLYVTLEPCCHHGKTPPCTELIIRSGIKRVVVSAIDPTSKMNGKGISILQNHGVQVSYNILNKEGCNLIAPFRTNQIEGRPHITLKTVKSQDNFIGQNGKKVWLSNTFTGVLTHKWRSEFDAIMVGTNTVLVDNPELTCRNYPGENPIRIIIDKNHKIGLDSKVFNHAASTLYFTDHARDINQNVKTIVFSSDKNEIKQILDYCTSEGIGKLLVEGGSTLIRSFVDLNLWDEARVITTPQKLLEGIQAVNLSGHKIKEYNIQSDHILHFSRSKIDQC